MDDAEMRAREALDDTTLPMVISPRQWERVLADVTTALSEARAQAFREVTEIARLAVRQ